MIKGNLTRRLNAAADRKTAPVSLKQALRLFDDLAAMPDMSFGYPEQGCYARAHLMCRKLEKLGVTPRKVWAFKEDKKSFHVRFLKEGREWRFHVAPVISVRLPNKTARNMVMDPSIFDGPATIGEWRKAIGMKPQEIQIVPLGVPPRGYKGDYNTRDNTTSKTDEDAMRETWKYIFDEKRRGPHQVLPSRCRRMAVGKRKTGPSA